MSRVSRENRRPGPATEAFGQLWRDGFCVEAVALMALASHVRTRSGECFPQLLCGPKFRAVGIEPATIAGIVDELEARGLVSRVGEWEASRFYVCRAIAHEIVAARRDEARRRLRVVEGGKRDAPEGL